ncbi:hypothetical protein J4573_46255 [Actinomadura barringtoniae]|uniref:Nuclear transport factor 2 family protein n=1 Tax=Actinomadura barringtoniae TaxID=1427535 RepID=A0A939PL04_9ACTN|nr:hypothetical protein [Actinomadura barringtoniae]MBO2454560.1 hypothetical protein [Actinomadura barringtoniae]
MHARLVRSSTRIASCCVLLAACGTHSSGSGAFNPNGATAPASQANTPAADQKAPNALPTQQVDKAVLDRYREYQRIYKQAYETNDPSTLNGIVIDPLLASITKDLNTLAAQKEVWRFTNALNPRIQGRSKDGMDVYVIDCVATIAAYRYSTTTGKRLGGGPGRARAALTVLRYSNGTWMVSDAKRGKEC